MRLLAICAVVVFSSNSLSADPVAARQELFKSFKNDMGAIKEIVAAGAVDKQSQLHKHAQSLAKASEDQWSNIDAHFAKGTDKGKTDALPAIWQDFDTFRAAADKNKLAVSQFVMASQKADAGEWKKAFGQVGGSCKGCHEKFRKD
jgi:cytochrome c556